MIKLSEQQQEYLDNYPKVHMTRDELDSLPEYSLTNPTQSGSIGIKRWKRRTPIDAMDDEAIWFLGEIEDKMVIFHHIVFKD